jgi:tripartite-type tricarboxylate transporter receptor subunit TctC
MRALAGGTADRNPLMPDVPTLAEAGQQPHPFAAWFAVVGPAGLPADIAARMNKDIVAALSKSEVREQMQKHGVIAHPTSLQETAAYIKDQNEIWKSKLQDAGLEPQ